MFATGKFADSLTKTASPLRTLQEVSETANSPSISDGAVERKLHAAPSLQLHDHLLPKLLASVLFKTHHAPARRLSLISPDRHFVAYSAKNWSLVKLSISLGTIL